MLCYIVRKKNGAEMVRSEKETFLVRGTSAITAAGAIGLGIICTTALSHIVLNIVSHIHRTKKQ